ncbi:MAG: 16S rRNA processing protein RimM [Acholeplasmatales bacterium]|nr:16S rRNA processing protein RimM [Acholeplasmatales bacterium]MBQ4357565.1 16S rRNA processing protein RimM [Acholeplasmatales bacterium]
MKYYMCGHIMTTHGIHGDLKVKNYSDFDRFQKGAKLYILHGKDYILVKVLKASSFGNYLLVRFDGLEDINLVEKYHSDDIYISEEDRKDTLEDGEFYYSDLIGKKVINQDGEDRGIVEEIREMPHKKYLAIRYKEKIHLVPFMEEFIGDVDEKIVVKEIEGLF